jgi:hypothetical protein
MIARTRPAAKQIAEFVTFADKSTNPNETNFIRIHPGDDDVALSCHGPGTV